MDVTAVEPDHIEFDVPWCLPKPLIEALTAKFPDVEFSGEFVEEQPGWYSGCFDTEYGALSFYYDIEDSDQAFERYFDFWGYEEDYQYIDGQYVYIDQ